jgi:hypothetical protein
MTNKKETDNKVKPIRKGIKVSEEVEDKLPPIPEVVERLKQLLKEAEEGSIREFVYITVNEDDTSRQGILGVPWNFLLTQNLIKILHDTYYDSITYPNLTGYFDGVDWDE